MDIINKFYPDYDFIDNEWINNLFFGIKFINDQPQEYLTIFLDPDPLLIDLYGRFSHPSLNGIRTSFLYEGHNIVVMEDMFYYYDNYRKQYLFELGASASFADGEQLGPKSNIWLYWDLQTKTLALYHLLTLIKLLFDNGIKIFFDLIIEGDKQLEAPCYLYYHHDVARPLRFIPQWNIIFKEEDRFGDNAYTDDLVKEIISLLLGPLVSNNGNYHIGGVNNTDGDTNTDGINENNNTDGNIIDSNTNNISIGDNNLIFYLSDFLHNEARELVREITPNSGEQSNYLDFFTLIRTKAPLEILLDHAIFKGIPKINYGLKPEVTIFPDDVILADANLGNFLTIFIQGEKEISLLLFFLAIHLFYRLASLLRSTISKERFFQAIRTLTLSLSIDKRMGRTLLPVYSPDKTENDQIIIFISHLRGILTANPYYYQADSLDELLLTYNNIFTQGNIYFQVDVITWYKQIRKLNSHITQWRTKDVTLRSFLE